MASNTAILAVKIVTDSRDAQKGVDQYGSSLDKLKGNLDRFTPAAAGVVAALALIGNKAVGAASELQQATGAVEAVFGAYADNVAGFAADAAKNVGLAESQYKSLASVLGAQLKNMGISQDQLAGQTDELITLGADLAATFGGTTADAVAALSSLMRGERDPIERYGVSIKQADIEAQKAAMGLAGLTGEADKNADTTATLALLYEQTGVAAGMFASETDTLAGSQQIANASFEDAMAKLGTALLPAMTALAGIATDLAGFIADNSTVFLILAGVLGTVAAAVLIVNGALAAYEAIQLAVTVAQWAWNAAMTANPIGLIIVAVGLLIAIIVVLVTNWETVERVFGEVIDNIVNWWNDLIDSFKHGFDQIFGWIDDALGWFGDLIGMGGRAASAVPSSFAAAAAVPADVVGYADAPSPALAAYTAAAPVRSSTGRAAGADAGPTVNITVNGALDPDAVAHQISQLLTRYGRNNGRLVTAGNRGF
jgi:hypothetical protein